MYGIVNQKQKDGDMHNILLPTDFSIHSLRPIREIAETISEKQNIFLFHAFDMPESLLDAIQKSGFRSHARFITDELRMKCKSIKLSHSNIGNIYFRIMYGSTVAAFKNFIEANQISLIVLPKDYEYKPLVRESVDPTQMIKKSGVNVLDRFDLHLDHINQLPKN